MWIYVSICTISWPGNDNLHPWQPEKKWKITLPVLPLEGKLGRDMCLYGTSNRKFRITGSCEGRGWSSLKLAWNEDVVGKCCMRSPVIRKVNMLMRPRSVLMNVGFERGWMLINFFGMNKKLDVRWGFLCLVRIVEVLWSHLDLPQLSLGNISLIKRRSENEEEEEEEKKKEKKERFEFLDMCICMCKISPQFFLV